ncbi:hypothetical protein GJ744_001247 [Endocarpon pusillum]|uniref:RAVE subunit 2/Rogdi n=1 Tax=Endocarpon pusillum TaxID=364733 RepID=A0A8H7E0Q1_9EURO|nr:hypothetical protein GJ744_001247 [Endocarpon pusillum]
MATWVYPPIPPDQLKIKEEESLAKEVQWLLESLQDSLALLKEGLEECVALLAPKEPGSTLVLSSLRSESVKGFVTRVGTKIVKGDINLRLSSLAPNVPRGTTTYPSTRYSLAPSTPNSSAPDLTLTPLLNLANHLNSSLDLIDITRWTGQSTSAPFISGQLRLLCEHLSSAKACLKGPSPVSPDEPEEEKWWLSSVPPSTFEPALNPNLSLHFSVHDASLVLTVRTLSLASNPQTPNIHTPSGATEFSLSSFNLRDRLFGLAGHHKQPTHDEMGESFLWRGKEEVNVREKVRVESADPSLMSVAAKLSALEHEVKRWRFNLGVVIGEEDD